MRGGWGAASRRSLYEYDHYCAIERGGFRDDVTAWVRGWSSTTGLASAEQFYWYGQVAKATVGLTYDSTTQDYAAAIHRRTDDRWSEGLTSSTTQVTALDNHDGVGFVSGVWRDRNPSGVDRILFSSHLDYPTTSAESSTHKLRQLRSTDEFGSSEMLNDLTTCGTMSGWYQCSTTNPIETGSPVAMAWDGQYTIFAWLNLDRTNGGASSSSNAIFASVGSVSETKLAQPATLSIRSSVPPALACSADFSGDYDCVVAYVPIDDMANRLVTRRFKRWNFINRYILSDSDDDTSVATARTASPMALMYLTSTNSFYLAIRSSKDGSDLEVYKSNTNATSWALVTTATDNAVTGVSTASTWRGYTTNKLVYLK